MFFSVCALLLSLKLAAQSSVLPYGSLWKYLDDGTDQGTHWSAPAFNDANWNTGTAKFGYGVSDAVTVVSFGTSPNKKHITTYFRKNVTIADNSLYSSYTANIKRDDGVVVYVNGVEVYRNNLPTGTISSTTLATDAKDNGTIEQSFTISASAFMSGTNVIAVEVHQSKANSPDMAFDLELTVTPKAAAENAPPFISISSPTDKTSSEVGKALTIAAIASDSDGSVTKVDFFANGSKIGEALFTPYNYDWIPLTAGTYSLMAKATDNKGDTTTSASITLNVTTATANDQSSPTILSINRQSPATATTDATSLTFRATFSEPVTGVDREDFSLTTVTGTVGGNLASNAVAAVDADSSTYDITVIAVSGNGTLRVDLKSSETGIKDLAGNDISGGYTSGQTFTIQQTIPEAEGFTSIINLDPIPISTTTGEKPQSKVWTYDGKHWAVLPNSTGTYLWRLDGKTWTNVLKLSTKTSTKADCKLVDNLAHILLYQGPSSQMASVEYDPAQGTYKLWSKRTSTVGLSLDKGVETATIDIDSNGRMWLASAGVSDINVRWSDSPYNTWSAPITIATGVNDDDICAIIAMPNVKKIGVLWSNQTTKRFGFKTHSDGDSPSDWSSDEVPASQSALNVGNGMADDHMNMALASDGTLYCAVKTSYDIKGYPKIILLVRRPTGTWDNAYEISQAGTRPIVVLNEANNKFRIIYSSQEYGGDILYRESYTSNILFSTQLTLIKGGTYDNSTSTKANFNTDVVILASSSTEAVGVLASDGTLSPIPNTPILLSPANNSTGVSITPTLAWHSSSGATSYQVQVSAASDFGTIVFEESTSATSVNAFGLTNNTNYYWRVKAINSEGSSSWSTVWSFKTSSVSTSPLVGHWKMDEGSGTTLVDATDYGNQAFTVGDPTWASGVDGQALRLDGSAQYATAPDHASLNITSSITLAAWVRPEKIATQYILKKAILNSTDGYELSLSNAGKVFFRFNQATAGDTYRLNSITSYPIDGTTWMHIAVTYDGSVIRIYINGEENSLKAIINPPSISANTLAFAIGAQSNGSSKFQGAIDDARIYNTALSATQVRELAVVPSQSTATTTQFASLQEEYPEDDLSAYPNPLSTKATIQFILSIEGDYTITLYNNKGAQVAILQQGKAKAGVQNKVEVNGAGLTKGLYIVKLQTDYITRTSKLVVNR